MLLAKENVGVSPLGCAFIGCSNANNQAAWQPPPSKRKVSKNQFFYDVVLNCAWGGFKSSKLLVEFLDSHVFI